MKPFLIRLSDLTRSQDWRLSFVPFIMGCVYLWLSWFKIDLNFESSLLILFSLVTTIGFAALGYLINEYFDIASDTKAGKVNRLAYVSNKVKLGLFLFSVSMALLPWLWLPHDNVTWFLIGAQFLFYLLYSLPFPRLKDVPFASNFIDAGYAYWIPLLLSHHTYALYVNSIWAAWLPLFSIAVFLVGFRNILIHQVDDLFNDKRAGVRTLPMVIGVERVTFLMKGLLVQEVVFIVAALWYISIATPMHFFVLVMYILSLCLLVWRLRLHFASNYFAIESVRHITDGVNQYVLPICWLVVLGFQKPIYLIFIPIHLLFFFPRNYWQAIKNSILSIYTIIRRLVLSLYWKIYQILSKYVNYLIYYFMRILGVDLVKENTSLVGYIKRKFRK
ncbi:MAG TPA: UbiA family prenyltransferase [Chitinophagales bacterium]|nr:UbiA family prenyltransferase [Chitinophagales bacterium]HRP39169.1 UbiA family prenyltransferase [Chitinophagales bacterium]